MVSDIIKWELSPEGTTHIFIEKDCFYWEKYTDNITRWIWYNNKWNKSNTYYTDKFIRIER